MRTKTIDVYAMTAECTQYHSAKQIVRAVGDERMDLTGLDIMPCGHTCKMDRYDPRRPIHVYAMPEGSLK